MSNADERIRENMKSYNHLYEKTISETNRRYALSQAKHSKRFRKIMKHRHMSDDAAVEQSLDWIVNYENAEHVPVYIYDGITRKERTIIVPTMEELLVQHCIVNAMKPMFCKADVTAEDVRRCLGEKHTAGNREKQQETTENFADNSSHSACPQSILYGSL